MKTKSVIFLLVVVVITLAAGAAAGVYVGFGLGASAVAKVSINTQVSHVESNIEALRALRDGKIVAAMGLIENRLDQDIVSLLPEYREDLRIPEQTVALTEKTIRNAKQYRARFPRTPQTDLLRRDIERAFSLVD